MTTTEAEVTAVHAPGTQLATYTPGQVEEYRPRIVMAPEDAKALDDQLRACMLAVLRPGVDYGTIPGMGDKPSLFKPGAEKLVQWFGFGFTSERGETERDSDGNRLGVTYRCTVTKGLPDGRTIIIATCEGYAGYDEDRFYTSAEQAWEKECALAERYKRQPRKWKAAEYRAPWNTVIKMAQKRAHVGAAIDATAAAGLFTQDLEDMTPPPGRDDENGGGTAHQSASDDAWENATPARPRQDPTSRQVATSATPATNGDAQPATPTSTGPDRPWDTDRALEEAASFKTEAAATRLYKATAAARVAGKCTTDEATHIQNLITARIHERRKEAATRILRPLDEGDPWRDKILDGLADDEEARGAIGELEDLGATGQLDVDRARLLARAIIARFPKAAVKDPEATA